MPNAAEAFGSVQHIMRDVNYGWLVRYLHQNGASMFFIVTYIHTFRGIYYGSYKSPRELLWILGVVTLLMMMSTAFMGYVLPWGQMSYWGATVITNMFAAIPFVGDYVVTWLWGGFGVDSPTLSRFYSLHYLLPFVLVAVVLLHITAIHKVGSNNPLGIDVKSPQDTLPFHPYYTVKDCFGLCVYLALFAVLVFFSPDLFGDPTNFIPANPLQTPADIQPEWYFLPFYAILRAVPNKLGGVALMFGAMAILLVLPWLDTSPVRSARFRPIYRPLFFVWLASIVLLGAVGAHKPEGIWVILGRIGTIYYFGHMLVVMPLLGWIERPLPLPDSISRPVINSGLAAARRVRRGDRVHDRFVAHRCAGRSCIPAHRRGRRKPHADAAVAKLELRRTARHRRSGGGAARLPDLRRCLLQLPRVEISALPRPQRHRVHTRPDQGDRRRFEVPAGFDNQGDLVTKPATPASSFRPPFPNDEAARAMLNGALPPDLSLIVSLPERTELHLCAADRLPRSAGGPETRGRNELQPVFPGPPDRHAAAAERGRHRLHGRHRVNGGAERA